LAGHHEQKRDLNIDPSSIVMLSLFTAAPALADAPDSKGQSRATEEKTPGAPENPNGWGSVVSDFGRLGIIGSHASSFSSPCDGLGTVARIDSFPGDDMGSHGEFAAGMSGGTADATDKPGN
jgi:hypothetical protein